MFRSTSVMVQIWVDPQNSHVRWCRKVQRRNDWVVRVLTQPVNSSLVGLMEAVGCGWRRLELGLGFEVYIFCIWRVESLSVSWWCELLPSHDGFPPSCSKPHLEPRGMEPAFYGLRPLKLWALNSTLPLLQSFWSDQLVTAAEKLSKTTWGRSRCLKWRHKETGTGEAPQGGWFRIKGLTY